MKNRFRLGGKKYVIHFSHVQMTSKLNLPQMADKLHQKAPKRKKYALR